VLSGRIVSFTDHLKFGWYLGWILEVWFFIYFFMNLTSLDEESTALGSGLFNSDMDSYGYVCLSCDGVYYGLYH
jgi:hypothetical protein